MCLTGQFGSKIDLEMHLAVHSEFMAPFVLDHWYKSSAYISSVSTLTDSDFAFLIPLNDTPT